MCENSLTPFTRMVNAKVTPFPAHLAGKVVLLMKKMSVSIKPSTKKHCILCQVLHALLTWRVSVALSPVLLTQWPWITRIGVQPIHEKQQYLKAVVPAFYVLGLSY